MAFAKFQENRFRIDRVIAENHAILVNLTASIVDISPDHNLEQVVNILALYQAYTQGTTW